MGFNKNSRTTFPGGDDGMVVTFVVFCASSFELQDDGTDDNNSCTISTRSASMAKNNKCCNS